MPGSMLCRHHGAEHWPLHSPCESTSAFWVKFLCDFSWACHKTQNCERHGSVGGNPYVVATLTRTNIHYSLLSPRALLKVGPGADSSSRVCMMQRTVWISKTNTDRPWWGPLLSIINVLHYSLLSPRALLKVGPGADSSSRVCMMQRTVWISKTNADRPWWGPLLSIINVLHYSLLSPRALLKVGPGADSSSRVCMMQRTVWISKTNTDRPWWGPRKEF